MFNREFFLAVFLGSIILVLQGCGGGGGSEPTPPPEPVGTLEVTRGYAPKREVFTYQYERVMDMIFKAVKKNIALNEIVLKVEGVGDESVEIIALDEGGTILSWFHQPVNGYVFIPLYEQIMESRGRVLTIYANVYSESEQNAKMKITLVDVASEEVRSDGTRVPTANTTIEDVASPLRPIVIGPWG